MNDTDNLTFGLGRVVLSALWDKLIAENRKGGDYASSHDWRGAIDATIAVDANEKDEAIDVYSKAVSFFVGLSPEVESSADEQSRVVELRFRSVGYRMGPCGP